MFNLRVRMTSASSLLLWAGDSMAATDSDFLMLEVVRGRVQVGGRENSIEKFYQSMINSVLIQLGQRDTENRIQQHEGGRWTLAQN